MIKLNGLGHVGGCGCGSCSGCSVPSSLKGLGGAYEDYIADLERKARQKVDSYDADWARVSAEREAARVAKEQAVARAIREQQAQREREARDRARAAKAALAARQKRESEERARKDEAVRKIKEEAARAERARQEAAARWKVLGAPKVSVYGPSAPTGRVVAQPGYMYRPAPKALVLPPSGYTDAERAARNELVKQAAAANAARAREAADRARREQEERRAKEEYQYTKEYQRQKEAKWAREAEERARAEQAARAAAKAAAEAAARYAREQAKPTQVARVGTGVVQQARQATQATQYRAGQQVASAGRAAFNLMGLGGPDEGAVALAGIGGLQLAMLLGFAYFLWGDDKEWKKDFDKGARRQKRRERYPDDVRKFLGDRGLL